MTPLTRGEQRVVRLHRAKGSVAFQSATFEQLPTQFMIVNALAELPVIEERGGHMIEIEGGRDLANQRALF